MITAIKKRFLIAVLAVMSVLMAFSGVCVLANANEQQVPQTALEQITFTMVDGASVRLDGRNGMRFAGQMSVLDYQKIEGAYKTLEYGVFIMPNFYAEDIGELNYENTFGGAKYVWGDQYDSPVVGEGADAKYRIIHMESLAVEKTINSENCYLVRGSVHDILPQNIATEYTACAYIKATPAEGDVEYKFATAMTTTRSMLEVAFRALNTGDYDDTDNSEIVAKKAILESYKTSYVECLGYEPTFSYTVNYVVDGVAEPVKTEKVENVAMNTAVSITPTAPEGYSLDMANEKNVLTGHVYLDNDVVLTVMVMEKKNEVITGTLYNDELYYFEKVTTNDSYEIVLPNALNEQVTLVKIGEQAVTATYDDSSKTLSIDASSISEIATGETILTIETPLVTYTTSVTVADYVVRSSEEAEIQKLENTGIADYIVIATDVDALATPITPSNWENKSNFAGTIDGKGHLVSNITLSTNSWWGLICPGFSGTLKNIAIVNLDNNTWGGGNGMISANADGCTLENVYISGNARNCNTLFGTVTENGVTLNNVIMNFASSAGVVGVVSGDMSNVTTNNVITVNSTGYDFFSENANLEFGDFKMTEKGLTFNGTLLCAKPDEKLVGSLYNGELAYLDKNGAETQSFVLPKAVGSVSNFKIGLNSIAVTYDDATKNVTINKSDIASIVGGIMDCTFVGDNETIYQVKLTVADVVVNNASEIASKLTVSICGSNYIVIADDIDASSIGAYVPNPSSASFTGTLDGKGHVISNLSLDGNQWWGLLGQINSNITKFNGTIKNIAFVNLRNAGGAKNGLLAVEATGGLLENVYISGVSYREHLFGDVTGNLTVNNVIINIEDGYASKGTICTGNSENDKDGLPASDFIKLGNNYMEIFGDANFFTENADLSFGDFAVTSEGLTFNGTLIYAKQA